MGTFFEGSTEVVSFLWGTAYCEVFTKCSSKGCKPLNLLLTGELLERCVASFVLARV